MLITRTYIQVIISISELNTLQDKKGEMKDKYDGIKDKAQEKYQEKKDRYQEKYDEAWEKFSKTKRKQQTMLGFLFLYTLS